MITSSLNENKLKTLEQNNLASIKGFQLMIPNCHVLIHNDHLDFLQNGNLYNYSQVSKINK